MQEDKSRSQKKRESTALQQLGEKLAALSPAALRALNLPQGLFDAIVEWQGMKDHEGSRRQMQYVGRLMREELDDPEAVAASLNYLGLEHQAATEDLHHLEALRESLISPDDYQRETAIGAALANYPALDGPKLRHLIDAALAERRKQKPAKAFREIFRYLRDTLPKQP